MEIYSEHSHNIGDEDIDIDIDLTVGSADDDHILDDAISDIDFEDENHQNPPLPIGYDDLMADDDYDGDDNRSTRMEDAGMLHPEEPDIAPDAASHNMDDGPNTASYASDQLDEHNELQEHDKIEEYNGHEEQKTDQDDLNHFEAEQSSWVSDIALLEQVSKPEEYVPEVEEALDLVEALASGESLENDVEDHSNLLELDETELGGTDLFHDELSGDGKTEGATSKLPNDGSRLKSPLISNREVGDSSEILRTPPRSQSPGSTDLVKSAIGTGTDSQENTDGVLPPADSLFKLYEVKVWYQNMEYNLFATSESDHIDSFFLKDLSVADQPIDNLFATLRGVLGEDISEEEFLCLAIDNLGLEFHEVSHATPLPHITY